MDEDEEDDNMEIPETDSEPEEENFDSIPETKSTQSSDEKREIPETQSDSESITASRVSKNLFTKNQLKYATLKTK